MAAESAMGSVLAVPSPVPEVVQLAMDQTIEETIKRLRSGCMAISLAKEGS
jgi:hypothetical protein